jgi:hypothetical protein
MYVKYEIQEDGSRAWTDSNPDFGIDLGEDLCVDCLVGWENENRRS